MKLYGSLTSPYVRKARVLLKEKSIECEFVVEKPGDAGTRFPHLNPLAKVPVLELDDEQALYDSAVICEYLDHLSGGGLIPAVGEARWEVLRWHALADGIIDSVVAIFLENQRPEQSRLDEAIEKQQKKVYSAINMLNREVKNREFLVGNTFTLADLAVGVALEYIDLRYPHDWRSQIPELSFWLASISARPSFQETVPPGLESPIRPRH